MVAVISNKFLKKNLKPVIKLSSKIIQIKE